MAAAKFEQDRFFGEQSQEVKDILRRIAEINPELLEAMAVKGEANLYLEEAYQLLDQVFSNIYVSVAYLDRDFNFLRVNQSYADTNGEPPEFFVGKNHFDLFPGEEAEKIFRRCVETGEPVYMWGIPFVFPRYPERGVTYWNWSLQPVSAQNGGVTRLLLSMVDVTEQKRAALALQESQALFTTLFDSSPDATLLVDSSGKIQAVSQQTLSMFGYSRDEMEDYEIEKLIVDLGKPDANIIRRVLQANESGSSEFAQLDLSGQRKDGSLFPAEVTFRSLKSSSGGSTICVVRNISRRVEAEKALIKQTAVVKLLQDIAVASNEAETLEGVLQYALDRICKFTDWPVGHAIMKNQQSRLRSTRLWHIDNPDQFALFRQSSESIDWERTGGLPGLVVSSGKPIWVIDLTADPQLLRRDEAVQAGLKSFFSFPVLAGKEPVGLLEFFSPQKAMPDPSLLEVMTHVGAQLGRVYERDQSRRALQRSEARFRTVFEESAIGILLNDPEGNFVESNPALQNMLGYSVDELRRLGLTEITHPDDLDRSWDLLKSLLRGDLSHYQVETRYLRNDGTFMWAQLTVSLAYDSDGHPQFVVTLVNDISEKKRMEQELSEVQRRLHDGVEAERLRLAMELHDGPLQDLYGASFQIQEIIPALRSASEQSTIRNSLAIVQQVISTLRSTVGELRPPTLIPFGLEKAIRSHADRWRQIYPDLEIHLELMSDALTLTENARLSLFRIYQQLISNVARHARASNLWVRLKLLEDQVILEVEDDGRGFSLPARWVELAREGHAGLLGVSERAEAVGGTMDIESAVDAGTLVRVSVPKERILRD